MPSNTYLGHDLQQELVNTSSFFSWEEEANHSRSSIPNINSIIVSFITKLFDVANYLLPISCIGNKNLFHFEALTNLKNKIILNEMNKMKKKIFLLNDKYNK